MKKNLIFIGIAMMLMTFASCGNSTNTGNSQVEPAVVHDTIVVHDSVVAATPAEEPEVVMDDNDVIEEEPDVETANDDALVEEHIAYLKSFYRAFFITNTGWNNEGKYLAHVSPAIKRELVNQYDYDCDSGDCYGWWMFRDCSQDMGDNISVTVTHDSGDWYNVRYKDRKAINVKVRVEGSGSGLMITGLRNPDMRVYVE